VPPGFAVRPLLEADLIVVVADKKINKARSVIEVAENLKEVVAFIELPDAFIATNPPPDGALLTAGNVGARLGVLGQRAAIVGTAQFVKALGDMKVTVTDQSGAELGRGEGRVILDHPLNSVLWLIEELHSVGERLKPGDMISLGSIKALPAPSGKSVSVRYDGLPSGPLEVSVRFR
jgi:2-keto-4-pentenoate hydratase